MNTEQKLFNNMVENYLHISVMSDIQIGQIEAYFFHKNNLVKFYKEARNDKEVKRLNRADDLMNRLLALSKIQYNESKRWVNDTVGSNEAYEAGFGVSKVISSMLKMSGDQIALMMLAVTMIQKGMIPTYIDLHTADLQRLSQKTNMPLEFIRTVFTHLVDVAIDPTDTLKNT